MFRFLWAKLLSLQVLTTVAALSVSAICDVDSTSQRSASIEFSSSDCTDIDQQAIFDTVSKVGEARRTYSCLHVLNVTLPS